MKSSNRNLIWLPLLWFLAFVILTEQKTPEKRAPSCDTFFYYAIIDGKAASVISLKPPKTSAQTGFTAKVVFVFTNPLQSDEEIPLLSPTKDQQEILKDIRAQKPITYIVTFNAIDNTLDVGRIMVNGGVVCENLKSIKSAGHSEIVQIKFDPPESTFEFPPDASDESCGVSLPTSGPQDNRREWPWLALMYVRKQDPCLANFISNTRAVTAARCIPEGVQATEIDLFIFSKRYLPVKNYQKHPKFGGNPDFDVAILDTIRIREPNFVPVSVTQDVTSLVGTRGSFVTLDLTNQKEYKNCVKVLSKELCNNTGFHTPRDSFCAGSKKVWTCHVGGGFFIEQDGRWYLRGILSTDHDRYCTKDDHAIFTDVTRLWTFVTGKSDRKGRASRSL